MLSDITRQATAVTAVMIVPGPAHVCLRRLDTLDSLGVMEPCLMLTRESLLVQLASSMWKVWYTSVLEGAGSCAEGTTTPRIVSLTNQKVLLG